MPQHHAPPVSQRGIRHRTPSPPAVAEYSWKSTGNHYGMSHRVGLRVTQREANWSLMLRPTHLSLKFLPLVMDEIGPTHLYWMHGSPN